MSDPVGASLAVTLNTPLCRGTWKRKTIGCVRMHPTLKLCSMHLQTLCKFLVKAPKHWHSPFQIGGEKIFAPFLANTAARLPEIKCWQARCY